MKVEILRKPEIIMSNSRSKHNYFGWPSVVRMADGTIIAGASGFRLEHVCPFGKTVIAYSRDNGKSFTNPMPVIDTVLDDRDAGLCSFGENGLIVTSFNNTRKMQRHHNEDNEATKKAYIDSYLDTISDIEEDEAIGSNFIISRDGGVSYGEIYKSPVTSPHGPVELKDGTVLWVGSNYFRNNNIEAFIEQIETYSIDTENGEMKFLGRIPDIIENGQRFNSCEPYAVESYNGDLICHIRTEETFTTYQSVSADGGRTWSVPERLLPDKGGAPCHILKHSSGTLVSCYGYRTAPYEIRAMFSTDNGKTWDTDNTLFVSGVSGDLGYPCSVELPDGSIYTVFYAKETDESSPCVIYGMNWKISE